MLAARARGDGAAGLAFDVYIHPEKNQESRADVDVASDSSAARVLVIRAQEEWTIARAAARVIREGSTGPS